MYNIKIVYYFYPFYYIYKNKKQCLNALKPYS